MTDFKPGLFLASLALSISACDETSPVADQADRGAPPESILTNKSPPAGEQAQAIGSTASAGQPSIPPSLHGRWGLTPAACESGASGVEGLLIVNAEELLFYESSAEPVSNIESSADSFSGEFSFRGEGQTERRFQSLRLDGDQLVRAGNGPAATFTYVRCNPGEG